MKRNVQASLRRPDIWRHMLLLSALALLAARPAAAQFTITLVSSDWTLDVGIGDVPSAGSDFAASFRQWDASDAQITITASNASRWDVTAGVRVPGGQSWPAALSVFVIRTGDGTGATLPAGPLNTPVGPLPTEPTETAFFNGRRTRSNIPIKLRIEGLTAAIPAGTYQVEVVYTVQ